MQWRHAAACLLAAASTTAATAADIRSERVQFERGSSGAIIQGRITGREAVDYLLGARAGQALKVHMETDNSANYFNIIPPDAKDEAIYAGASSTDPNRYAGALDLDGDWTVRVYLVRAAARRGESANYRLDIGITGDPDPSAAREANDFGPREWDARGDLDCALGGQPLKRNCPFKVVRYRLDDGATLFTLAPGSGEERILYLLNGEWSTPSGETVSASKREDIWTLKVGDETYEFPDALPYGG